MFTGNIGYTPYTDPNIVKDWRVIQGVTSGTDLGQGWQPWNIHVRGITIENGSDTPVIVVINNDINNPHKDGRSFYLEGKELKEVGINSQGGTAQFIHLFDYKTKWAVSEPTILDRTTNSFVLRNGLNKWFVHRYHRPSYFPSH